MCSAKLGVLAALAVVMMAYLSVKLFKLDWFVQIDPVKKTRLIHWNKILGTSLTMAVVITLLSYWMNA